MNRSTMAGFSSVLRLMACTSGRPSASVRILIRTEADGRPDVQAISLSTDENPAIVERFMKERKFNFPVLVSKSYVERVLPEVSMGQTSLVDQSAAIRLQRRNVPYLEKVWVDEALDKLNHPPKWRLDTSDVGPIATHYMQDSERPGGDLRRRGPGCGIPRRGPPSRLGLAQCQGRHPLASGAGCRSMRVWSSACGSRRRSWPSAATAWTWLAMRSILPQNESGHDGPITLSSKVCEPLPSFGCSSRRFARAMGKALQRAHPPNPPGPLSSSSDRRARKPRAKPSAPQWPSPVIG